MLLNDKIYNALRWVAQYLLPGLATLYFALSEVWGFPYVEQIVGTIVIINTFLGALLGISTHNYNKQKAFEGYIDKVMEDGDDWEVVSKKELVTPKRAFVMPSDVYNMVKWLVMIALPSAGAMYFGLSQIWGFPYGQQVIGTIAAVTAFAGLVLGFSTYQYKNS